MADDIINYIKPSLERHAGCDIVDLYPGVGLWSRKIHELLNPRSHLLLEPNAKIYKPFLEPLLSKPNTQLLQKSGIVWSELNSVLTPEFLPHQIPHDPRGSAPPKRNDTLLVLANISFFPKRKWAEHNDLCNLLLFQFIRSIRSSTLFQKYGLVRMLLWANDGDKATLLPRFYQKRNRLAVEGELATEWLTEVAGGDMEADEGRYRRWRSIDVESTQNVLAKMADQGFVIPAGRETNIVQELRSGGNTWKPGQLALPIYKELAQLEADLAKSKLGKEDPKHKRLQVLRYTRTNEDKIANVVARHMEQYEQILERLAKDRERPGNERGQDPSEDAQRAQRDFTMMFEAMSSTIQGRFMLARHNLHLFRQDLPVLSWDRRYVEPLVVKPEEFFPNSPCCLLDIQPKAGHPLLRDPQTSAVFDLLLQRILSAAPPLTRIFDAFSPGAADGVLGKCDKIYDPTAHGIPLKGAGELWPRAMNQAQLENIIEAWKQWPFAPSYRTMLGQLADVLEGQGGDEPEHNSGRIMGTYDLP